MLVTWEEFLGNWLFKKFPFLEEICWHGACLLACLLGIRESPFYAGESGCVFSTSINSDSYPFPLIPVLCMGVWRGEKAHRIPLLRTSLGLECLLPKRHTKAVL